MFQVRIHCIDYCLATPSRVDIEGSLAPIARNNTNNVNNTNNRSNNNNHPGEVGVRVPVIRVFGATATGEIACAHIHGVFPYLFVPFDGLPFSELDRIIASLRHGINQALGRTAVLAITPVRGIPFYGFNVGFRLFLKIYLLDPSATVRVAEMLRQGRVAGIPQLMPHESHIPFLLQFMTDYNLYGCDLLTASEASTRNGGDRDRSSCPVQVDILAQHIRNRDAVPERRQHVSFPETPTPSSQRLVYSLAALWREMAARYDKGGKKSDEDRKAWEAISTQDAFAQLGASSSDPRRTPSPWLREEEYRAQIADIIEAERAGKGAGRLSDPPDDHFPTIRQSVEDFYPRDERADSRKRKRRPDSDSDSDSALESCQGAGHVPDTSTLGSNEDGAASEEKSGLGHDLLRKVPAPATSGIAKKLSFPSSDPEVSQGSGTPLWIAGKTASHEERERSRSQPLEIRLSQERHMKKKPQNLTDAHRPLSQSFSVVKSAFSQETPPKNDLSDGISMDREENKAGRCASFRRGVLSASGLHKDEESAVEDSRCSETTNTRAFCMRGDVKSVGKVCDRDASRQRRHTQRQGPFHLVSRSTLAISMPAPDKKTIMGSLGIVGPDQIHQGPHFSREHDKAKSGPATEGTASITSMLVGFDFSRHHSTPHGHQSASTATQRTSTRSWQIHAPPPTYAAVESWICGEDGSTEMEREASLKRSASVHHRMAAARLPREKRTAVLSQKPVLGLSMQTLCLEVHANSRDAFLPNPERDPVLLVAWKSSGRAIAAAGNGQTDENREKRCAGVISVGRALHDEFGIEVVTDEYELLSRVVQIVQDIDPDILTGYEITALSWSYLAERAATYEIDLWQELSRVRQPRVVPYHEHGQAVTGRLMLSIDQVMRSDLDLRQYNLETAAWAVLGRRIPFYAARVLTSWSLSSRQRDFSRLVRHYRRRAALGLALLEATELVARAAEQARVLGVDFASVLDRGSQFKVESVMLRVAKPEDFVMPSPNHEQVGQQNAAECMPLILEPRSAFYSSPVVVLDFTSLYPSLMIAYNLCYSTFLGRLDPLYSRKTGGTKEVCSIEETERRQKKNTGHIVAEATTTDNNDVETAAAIDRHRKTLASKMGFATYNRPPGILEQLSQLGIVVSPTGVMYVGTQTRQSLLAKMLAEILDTRVMVKAALKRTAKANLAERQRLNSRQLALKLLANVTYGYTSASFSGRMPCVEVADSIVQTGRETLNRAIALIHSVRRWNAEVVYGDTDSLFVHLPGRTRAQAFQIGAEMAEAVTASNPHPVRLKFEKVYHPCVLLAKKRYVGYEFDTVDQEEPIFDAKGIETVRRDGTPAASKVLEQCLRILFDSADLTQVKDYVLARFDDIANNRLPLADLCFAKEVRQPGSYRAPPPGAMVAARRMAKDPHAVLLHGERVPYVVLAGPPGTPLRDRCVSPEELIRNPHARIDSDYYIRSSVIPPLDRIFRLVGANIEQWYLDMPRIRMPLRTADPASTPTQRIGQMTLDVWLRGARCALCDTPVRRRRRQRLETWRRKLASTAVGKGATTCSGPSGTVNTVADDADADADDEVDGCKTGSDSDTDAANDNDNGGPYNSTAHVKHKAKPILCKACGRDNIGTLFSLQRRARDAENAYRIILHGCRSCAGLGVHDELRCENMTCPVYFVRTERLARAKTERSKASLIEALARRGMENLEW